MQPFKQFTMLTENETTLSDSTNEKPTFQKRIYEWCIKCFGEKITNDKQERNHKFLEESLELAQSLGCTKGEAFHLLTYVFDRPIGEPHQEVGGVMVTLAALCNANGLSMTACGEVELERIYKMIEKIRIKQQKKPKYSALPEFNMNSVMNIEFSKLRQEVIELELKMAKLSAEFQSLKKNDEKDLIIHGLEEGAASWKAEYDNCRSLLSELVSLKNIKDNEGKTENYLEPQPEAWEKAKIFINQYQHF